MILYKPGHYYKRTYNTNPPCWIVFRVVTPSATTHSMRVMVLKDEGFDYDSRGDMLYLVDTSDWNTVEIDDENILWEVL